MTHLRNPRSASGDYPLPADPPAAGPLHDPAYPLVSEAVLDNGLRVLAIQDHRIPRYSVRVGLEAGRLDNPQSGLALASLAVEMLQEGTETLNSRQFAEEIDRWAIQLDSEVNLEFSALSVSVLDSHLKHALALLTDMLLHPTFPASELEKIKVRWHSSLVAQRAQPTFLAREAAFKAHFPGHPYSRIEIPLKDLGEATQDQVQAFYLGNVSPQRCCLLFAGPVDLEGAVELADQFLGGWRSSTGQRPDVPEPPRQPGRRVRLVHRPHSVQSRIQVSGEGPARAAPDALLFRLTNQVFGGSGSSRIFLNLRERNGYTYGAYSVVHSFKHRSLYLAGAEVGVDVTVPALREVFAELETFRAAPPSDAELHRSSEELIGGLIRRLETSTSVGALEVRRRLTGLPADYYTRFSPQLRAVTPGQVVECARQWFDPENCLVTVVGDREKVEADLSEFGEVEVVDTDGRRLE